MAGWFEIKNAADSDVIEIRIYDEIGGWGIYAEDILRVLDGHPDKRVKLRINSNGGDIFQAIALHSNLSERNTEVLIDGIAASAATLVAMAGTKIIMPENAMMMIHNPLAGVVGEAEDLRDMADALDKAKELILATYMPRAKVDRDELSDMLNKGTWLTASEAVNLGFADELKSPIRIAAQFDVSRLPDNVRSIFNMTDKQHTPAAPDTINVADVQAIVNACTKAGYPALAARCISNKATLDDVQHFVAEAKAIKNACKTALLQDAADGFIADGKSLTEVKAALFDQITAKDSAFLNQQMSNVKAAFFNSMADADEGVPTDQQQLPDAGVTQQPKAKIDTAHIYNKRREVIKNVH